MSTRSLRNRLADTTNIWPGFVDVLATLLIVIIFVLMVFTVSQIYLSDAISGRDKALQILKENGEIAVSEVDYKRLNNDYQELLSKQKEEMAAAVYGPTPVNLISSLYVLGNSPLNSSCTCLAVFRRFLARE